MQDPNEIQRRASIIHLYVCSTYYIHTQTHFPSRTRYPQVKPTLETEQATCPFPHRRDVTRAACLFSPSYGERAIALLEIASVQERTMNRLREFASVGSGWNRSTSLPEVVRSTLRVAVGWKSLSAIGGSIDNYEARQYSRHMSLISKIWIIAIFSNMNQIPPIACRYNHLLLNPAPKPRQLHLDSP